MNILSDSLLRPCTSCQVCAAVCPVGAIKIEQNKDGFYRPVVNDACVDCGRCVESCYKFDHDIKDGFIPNYSFFSAMALDGKVLKHTTSGGIADILARHLVTSGYTIIGVVYDTESDTALAKVSESVDGTLPFRGSKYIQSYNVDAYKYLVKNMEKKLAVFGLPCQIYAISKYVEAHSRRENCLLIDLYCHGCPSMNLWKKYLQKLKSVGVCWDEVFFRSKYRGWGDFAIEMRKGGKAVYVSSPMHNEFYEIFFSDQILNDSCSDCKLRGTLRYSDIRLGDFWGPKYKRDIFGTSAISISTGRGLSIIEGIRDKIIMTEESYDTFLPYQSWGKEYRVNPALRSRLLSMLSDNQSDITTICKQEISVRYCFKKKIKILLKELLSRLPQNFYARLRRKFS